MSLGASFLHFSGKETAIRLVGQLFAVEFHRPREAHPGLSTREPTPSCYGQLVLSKGFGHDASSQKIPMSIIRVETISEYQVLGPQGVIT